MQGRRPTEPRGSAATTEPPESRGETAVAKAQTHGSGRRYTGCECERQQGLESLHCFQIVDRFGGSNLAVLEPLQHLRAGWRRVGVHELEKSGDAIQAGLDGRVADPKDLLHLLDGAVGAKKCGDEDLVFQTEARQLGQRECALDSDLLFRDPYALDDYWGALGDPEQILPIGS